MRIDILSVIPLWYEGMIINKDAVVTLLMNFAWVHVGQEISYRKFVLNVRWPITFQFQIFITRYGAGGLLEEHIDSTHEDEKQFRLMVLLKRPKQGGELICEKFIINRGRIKLFEPNRYKHQVTKVVRGERLVALISIRYAWKRIRPCHF